MGSSYKKGKTDKNKMIFEWAKSVKRGIELHLFAAFPL